jgi:hypothetical protein
LADYRIGAGVEDNRNVVVAALTAHAAALPSPAMKPRRRIRDLPG